MKKIINILFVWFPFIICILIQVILVTSLYFTPDTENIAVYGKWLLPVIIVIATILHYKKNKIWK